MEYPSHKTSRYMKLRIKIKPNARVEKVQDQGGGNLLVWVRPAAREGKANEALIEALSEYLDIPKSLIRITAGHSSRIKTVSVDK
jgi:hypothetical protein